MLKAENLKKEFVRYNSKKKKEKFFANKGISFTADEGEILGILGPNGAGKTTLLRMIGGILEPSAGSIDIDGLNYKDNAIEIKKNIAYLSGNTKIYNSISTYELLKMCCDFYDVDKQLIEERITEISEILNMKDFLIQKIESITN